MRAADPFLKQLGHFDVAVVVHSCSSMDRNSATVSLLPSQNNAGPARICLFDPPKVQSPSQVQDAVVSWTRNKVNAKYMPKFLLGMPSHLEMAAGNLLADMSRMGAIQGSMCENPYHIFHDEAGAGEKLEVLERLMDVEFATPHSMHDGRSSWLLNMRALSQCSLQLDLKSPRPFFAVPEGQPALTWSRMEVLCYLQNAGWEWQFLQTPAEKREVVPLDLTCRVFDDNKIYIYRGALSHRYLTCLSFVHSAKSLHGEPLKLKHFETDSYYCQLLCLKTKKQQQLALEDSEQIQPDMFRQVQDLTDDFESRQDQPSEPNSARAPEGDASFQESQRRHEDDDVQSSGGESFLAALEASLLDAEPELGREAPRH